MVFVRMISEGDSPDLTTQHHPLLKFRFSWGFPDECHPFHRSVPFFLCIHDPPCTVARGISISDLMGGSPLVPRWGSNRFTIPSRTK